MGELTFKEHVPGQDSQIALRERFVLEYVKDFDAVRACLRSGFEWAFAVEYAKRFMREPYVIARISELRRSSVLNADDEEQQDRNLIKSVLREAAQNGPFATRVAAAGRLAAIYGMDRPSTEGDGASLLVDAMREFASKAG